MKGRIIFLFLICICAFTLFTGCGSARSAGINYGNFGRLVIDDLGIDVAVNLISDSDDMDALQAAVDWEDSACMFNRHPGYLWVITDHYEQGFMSLPESYVGCTGHIVNRNGEIAEHIRCVETDPNGYNDDAHGLADGSGYPMELRYGPDVYALYTCYGSTDGIYISYWVRE